MKQLATSCLVLFLFLAVGCNSSKKTKAMEEAPSPLLGSWVVQGKSSPVVEVMSASDIMIPAGEVYTAINRFQNTARAKYNTRLANKATYEFNGSDQLTLNVMADWSGKGTGSRRAEDKSVASSIVFSVQEMGDSIKLTKVSMSQSNSGTDNTNSNEALSFTLKKM